MATITLYGGVNEIGGNKFLLEEDGHRLLLDFGTSIGARNGFFEEFLPPRTNSILRDLLRLGLLPDVDGIYREDLLTVARAATDRDLPESAEAWRRRGGRAGADAILITHAHVDHFQDLSFVDPEIPVYCTPTTKAMLTAIEDVRKAKVDSEILSVRLRSVHELGKAAAFPGSRTVDSKEKRDRAIHEIAEGSPCRVGAFEVTPIPVDHSVPGGCAYLIKTPSGKRVFYTGDVRFHGRLLDRTQHLLKAVDGLAPDVMLSEGTRMDSDASDNEADVERGVAELADEAQGLVVAEFGWKDTTRFDTLQRVAERTGRTLVVDPRLAYLLRAVHAREDVPSTRVEDYANVRVYRRRKDSMLGEPGDYEKHELGYATGWSAKEMREATDEAFLADALAHYRGGLTAAEIRENPDKYVVHLTFFASNELFDLDPPAGSRWIRCSTEPYSDEMAFDMDRQRNWLEHFGMAHNVPKTSHGDAGELYAKGRVTHVSGHGARPDLERLVRLAQPKKLVPVHTQEKSLDRFHDLGFATTSWRKVGWREAGKGKCVVDF